MAELSCHASMMTAQAPVRPGDDLVKGVWRQNPVLVHALGLCPTLAVTNSVVNAVVMGVATLFVLVSSSILVSSAKRIVPNEIRISTYILIVATFVTVTEQIIQALVPEVHKALGPFVALIVVNCIILARLEAFAAKHPVGRSVLDAVGMGIGFMLALLLMGTIREVLGSGTFLGVSLFGAAYQPWVIMVLPPGGFFTLAFMLLTMNWLKQRHARRRDARADRAAGFVPAGQQVA
jgi:electron transport complex protein RnfE